MCAGADGGQPSPFLLNCVNVGLDGEHYEYQAQDTPFLGNADLSHLSSMFLLLVSAYGTQDAFQK